jgi:hypothetical protein
LTSRLAFLPETVKMHLGKATAPSREPCSVTFTRPLQGRSLGVQLRSIGSPVMVRAGALAASAKVKVDRDVDTVTPTAMRVDGESSAMAAVPSTLSASARALGRLQATALVFTAVAGEVANPTPLLPRTALMLKTHSKSLTLGRVVASARRTVRPVDPSPGASYRLVA